MDRLSVNGKDAIFWDSDLPGFGVRVYPSGKKVFVVQTRAFGRSKRVSLGTHGDTNFSVDHARKKATLIEDIYRSVYLLTTTLRGQELLRAERKEELDSIVSDGLLAMAEALGKDWACGVRRHSPENAGWGRSDRRSDRDLDALAGRDPSHCGHNPSGARFNARPGRGHLRTSSKSRRAARLRFPCRAARDHAQFPVMLSRLTIAPSMSNSSGGIP